ncbi:MAG: chitobiase/beta-hexosaminidase C-terminal domain-containing protein [Methanobacteriaceae archaeon]|nr:chitobiase/beta-hexosaminidase C-terminal domain-containing protein [Methanobacteriaceae archaeon]
MNIFKKKSQTGEGVSLKKNVKIASLLFLSLVFILTLTSAVSAANTPLNTTHNGTVSGDLYVNATQPVAFASQPTDATTREFNQTFNLPTNSSAGGNDIEWAQAYVNIYSGSGSANWPVQATIMLDGNGDGTYEATLGNELLTSENYSIDGTIYWINDHCYRVYSDYQLWYDVTGLINCTNPSIYVKTEKVGTDTFDGRLKMITLVAAYNDGDTDKVHYWVNDGQDWITSGDTSQTTFNTSTVDVDIKNATLNTVALSSKDGSYNFNGETHTGTNPVAPINYFVTHTWDVTAAVTRGNDSTLSFTAVSGSFKMVLATLTVRETAAVAPEADFTADTTSGASPLTVQFTDTSTGTVTGWAWDFDNDGITDSTDANPTWTYTSGGTYTVNLTVTGPGGTDTETKTNYIAVIPENYVTYLGGSSADSGYSVAVDNIGNIYIVGSTQSLDFPTSSDAYQPNIAGVIDMVLAKFNSNGNLVYSTYFGGASEDRGYGIVLDNSGNVYITGYTASTNFPTTSDAYQTIYGGGSYDAFVSKFNSIGTLVYSSYLGGTNTDQGNSIAVDTDGNIYITGKTISTNFPTTSDAYQATKSDTSTTYSEVFVSKFNSSGALVYSTYLGGSKKSDYGSGIAVDNEGNIYITGRTESTSFPITTDAYQTSRGGSYDAFLSKFSSSGALVYSTYLGGTTNDYGSGIAVDNEGNIYITGYTASSNFPTTAGAYQTTCGGGNDAFLSKFSSSGTLVYSTYLGGTTNDYVNSIAIDNEGNIYITGFTASTNFPTTAGAYQTIYGGGSYDTFVSKFSSNGTLAYSTYLGGTEDDEGFDVAVNSDSNMYITGFTASTNFPTTAGAYQTTYGGNSDAFLVKISIPDVDTTAPTVTASPTSGIYTALTNVTLSATDDVDPNPKIYYTTDGSDPTTSSTLYTGPISFVVTTTLKFIGVDATGNTSPVQTETYTINDTQAPVVNVNPIGSNLTSAVQVILSATDDVDPNPKIYYTTDGSDPTTSSTLYTAPISISKTTTLKFIGVDASGNISPVQSETYNDSQAPTVTASLTSGTYNPPIQVTLSAADSVDPNPAVYYTLDGSDPTTSSTLYTGPITITSNTTLKFIVVDDTSNTSPVQMETYNMVDTEAPNVTASQNGNTITLSATDNSDPNPAIYYTTDGTDPTSSSTPYSGPFTIPDTAVTLVKFIAVDAAGNTLSVQSKCFSTIQTTDILTSYYAEGNIGVVVDNGGTVYYGGNPTYNLSLPSDATILAAYLCLGWTWYGYTPYTVSFNGNTIASPIAHYVDGNDGQDVYDVTAYMNAIGTNTAIIGGGSAADYGRTLIVVYQSASEPYREIWINMGYDIIPGYTGYGATEGPGHAYFLYATNTEKASSAEIIITLPSGDNDSPSILVNGETFTITSTGGSDPSFKYYTITITTVQNGINTLEVPNGGYMSLANAILTITYDFTAPTVSASVGTGVFGDSQNVTLNATDNMDTGPDIYYTIDGTTPTVSSTLYTGPITIAVSTVLKFFAVDGAGNASPVQSKNYIIDTAAPVTSVDLVGGLYNSTFSVVLDAMDNIDAHPVIYYTLNGETPTIDSLLYNKPLIINSNTNLQFIAVDLFGNTSPVQTETYTIDSQAPTVAADITGGLFNTSKTVKLTGTDNLDTNINIHYTTDGSTPTTNCTLYTGPILLNKTTTLKFMAVDSAGNTSPTQTQTYTIDTTQPTITSTDPKNGATQVAAGKTIKVIFSEDIKKGHMWIELLNSKLKAIPFTATISGNVLTVDPNSNLAESLYTLWIHTGAVTDQAGNPIAVKSTKFSSGTPPTITSVNPANNRVINVANKVLVITFSEVIKAGGAFSNIKVTNPDGVSVKPLYKVINGKTLTLTRNGNYINGLTYTITLPTGSVTDQAGNAITAFTSKFTADFVKPTITGVNPANNKVINVANKVLVITFSEAIKAGSVFSSIKVTNPDGVSVKPLYKVINGKTLTLTRNGNYINGLTYTITLPTGSVTDQAGNTITKFTSKFKIDTTKPTITTTNPKNNSSGYSLTALVTITFSENMLEGVNWSRITMKNLNTGKAVSFTKTRNGKTLTIKMIYSRLHKNTYQIYIPAEAVKDNTGNKQTTPYTLTFKTQ